MHEPSRFTYCFILALNHSIHELNANMKQYIFYRIFFTNVCSTGQTFHVFELARFDSKFNSFPLDFACETALKR